MMNYRMDKLSIVGICWLLFILLVVVLAVWRPWG